MKLLMTNVVYTSDGEAGDKYLKLFLEQHLKSLLDRTNIPAHADSIEMMIFADAQSAYEIQHHPNYLALKELIDIQFWHRPLEFPASEMDQYDFRYTILSRTFQQSVAEALNRGCYLSALTADYVFAAGFIPKMFARIAEGYDSVLGMPMRTACEPLNKILGKYDNALPAELLGKAAYENLHPLWTACHWRTAQFTKLPFTLLWNTRAGLLARSYSVTPYIFKPTEQMAKERAIIDIHIPHMLKKPYWATDWIEAPAIENAPLFTYYPTWANHIANTAWVKEWAARTVHPSQVEFLKHKLYYPSRAIVESTNALAELESDVIVQELIS